MNTWVMEDRGREIPISGAASTGPSSDFGDIVSAAWEDQRRNWSQNGREIDMLDEMERARERMAQQGVELPIFTTEDIWFLNEHIANGKPLPEKRLGEKESLGERFEKFNSMSDVPLSDMFDNVVQRSQEADARMRDVTRRSDSIVKDVAGSLVGAGGAMVNIARDPAFVGTIGAGGFGGTALRRIGTEALVAAGIEGGTLFGSVLGKRNSLGLETSNTDIAAQIALSAGAAGFLRAGGEAIGAIAGRRAARREAAETVQQAQEEVPIGFDQTEPQRVRFDEATGATKEMRRLDVVQDLYSVDANERRAYRDAYSLQGRAAEAAEADLTWKANALHEAAVNGVFNDLNKTFDEALGEIVASAEYTGQKLRPFADIVESAENLTPLQRAQHAHPEVFAEKTKLEKRIAKLEDKMMGDEKRPPRFMAEGTPKTKTFNDFIAKEREAGRITGYSIEDDGVFIYTDTDRFADDAGAGTFRGDSETAAIKQYKANARAVEGADVSDTKLGKMYRDLDNVEDHITNLVSEQAQTTPAQRFDVEVSDSLGPRQFSGTAASYAEFSKELDDFYRAYHDNGMYDATEQTFDQLKLVVDDEEIGTVTLGDIKDIPLDDVWLDADGNEKTVRQLIKEAGADDNLQRAMMTCRVG